MERDEAAIDTIPHRLLEQAKTRPDEPAYYEKVNGRYQPTTWREYASLVRRAGKAFMALGVDRGSTVAILGSNRSEWVIADLAVMSIGGAPAGVYTTSSSEEVQEVVGHAGSRVLVLENEAQWRKVERQLARLPHLEHVVFMRGAGRVEDPLLMTWERFLASGDAVEDRRFDDRLRALEPEGLATLIYTSGTTGPPKGVMLSHKNLAWTGNAGREILGGTGSDRSLSYLPLSHIAEQVFTIHGPVTMGSAVYFAESPERFFDNLREVQPTFFFGVPRVWEKLSAGVTGKLREASFVRRAIAATAMRVGKTFWAVRNQGGEHGPLLKAAHSAMAKLVFTKIKTAIGLGRARFCVSGAAPISPAVLEFFSGIDLPVYEIYGQSEDTGPTTMNRPEKTRVGTVGQPLPGIEVAFAEDGEILVKGPNVFLGYYKDAKATAETIANGFLCSGDLGRLDNHGYLVITGRKKEILITAGGKNITPKNIEGWLKNDPLVAEAVVVGDGRRYLTALILPDPDAVSQFKGAPHETEAAVRKALQRVVDEVNDRCAQVETIKKFHVLTRPFTIDTGELTPTLKVRRRVVYERYVREIDAMYAGDRGE